MKRIIGAILMVGGAACLFCFAAWGTLQGRDIQASPAAIPFLSLGRRYPGDTVLLLGAFWGLLMGLALVVAGAPGASRAGHAAAGSSAAARYAASAGRRGGVIARFMLLNGLLLLSTLLLAYIGGVNEHPEAAAVGVFGLIAFAQMAVGIMLAILALFERPKGVIPLIVGIPIHIFGIALGLLAFFVWGGA